MWCSSFKFYYFYKGKGLQKGKVYKSLKGKVYKSLEVLLPSFNMKILGLKFLKLHWNVYKYPSAMSLCNFERFLRDFLRHYAMCPKKLGTIFSLNSNTLETLEADWLRLLQLSCRTAK